MLPRPQGAQRGIYSDPAEDGFGQGSVYPEGPWRPPSSVQRGSIQFISLCPGDPSRAYLPAGASEELCGYTQSELIPTIPVLPLSYGRRRAGTMTVDGASSRLQL